MHFHIPFLGIDVHLCGEEIVWVQSVVPYLQSWKHSVTCRCKQCLILLKNYRSGSK